MLTLYQILKRFKDDFDHSKKGQERNQWFICTLLAVIFPFNSSKTSNLLRCLHTVFGFTYITKRRFYTFMSSSKIPWERLWETTRKAVPAPLTKDRLLLALDDYINPKIGKKIFGCHRFFDHAAKQNQSRYPWAQNIVVAGLLSKIKGCWACLPLVYRFYHPKKEVEKQEIRVGKDKVSFQTKLDQAAKCSLNSIILTKCRYLLLPTHGSAIMVYGHLLKSNWEQILISSLGFVPTISFLDSLSLGVMRKNSEDHRSTENFLEKSLNWLQSINIKPRHSRSTSMGVYGRSWPLIRSLWLKHSNALSEWFGSIAKLNGLLYSALTCPSRSSKLSSIMAPTGRSNPVSKNLNRTLGAWKLSAGIPMQWSIT